MNNNSNQTNQPKKPFYKLWWFWLIVVIVAIALIGSIGGTNSNKENYSSSGTSQESTVQTESAVSTTLTTQTTTSSTTQSQTTKTEETTVTLGPKEKINQFVRNRIKEKYTYTDISSITINENLGTDADDDYVVLVRVIWNQKNSGKMSKTVLKLYSDDLASMIAEKFPNVQEIAIFWTVPYLNNANAKCSYERKNGSMYEMDMMWDTVFNK